MDCNQFHIQCNGQFGSRRNFITPQNSKILFYAESSKILNEEILIQSLLNYIMIISQRLPRQISVPLNLFNIVLPNIRFQFIVLPNIRFQFIVLPNIHFNFVNVKFYKWVLIQNIDIGKSCLDKIISKPQILTVLKEFNIISHSDYNKIKSLLDNNLNSKKRQMPDYDDYDLDSRKRAKPFQKHGECSNDNLEVFENNSTAIVNSTAAKNPIDVVKTKWNNMKIADPHIDNTLRIISSKNINIKRESHNEERCTSSLLIYDKEITKIQENIGDICRYISILCLDYIECKNLRESCLINDKINKFRHRENSLKNRYVALCEARDEVNLLYGSNKKSSLNFSAELITQSELNANNSVRQMFKKYEEFYGFGEY